MSDLRRFLTDLGDQLVKNSAACAGSIEKYFYIRPVELVYAESFETKEQAMSREWHLKRLSRAQKLALLEAAKTPCQPRTRSQGGTEHENHS